MKGSVLVLTAVLTGSVLTWSAVRANAPVGRYVVSAGTVYDVKTKLTWQQSVSPTVYQATDAAGYCSNLGATLGGAGWRVPTIKELATLLDHSQSNGPWIDRSAFPSTPLHMFWSSTPLSGSSAGPWVVDFALGNISLPGMSTSNNVRCVR